MLKFTTLASFGIETPRFTVIGLADVADTHASLSTWTGGPALESVTIEYDVSLSEQPSHLFIAFWNLDVPQEQGEQYRMVTAVSSAIIGMAEIANEAGTLPSGRPLRRRAFADFVCGELGPVWEPVPDREFQWPDGWNSSSVVVDGQSLKSMRLERWSTALDVFHIQSTLVTLIASAEQSKVSPLRRLSNDVLTRLEVRDREFRVS